jgi:hypothetical protein
MEQTSGRLVKLGLGVQCFSLKDTATLGGGSCGTEMPAFEDPPLMTSLNDMPAADTLQKRKAMIPTIPKHIRSFMNKQYIVQTINLVNVSPCIP